MKFESERDLPIYVLYAWIKCIQNSNIWKESGKITHPLN